MSILIDTQNAATSSSTYANASTISTTVNVSGGSGVQEVLVAAAYEGLEDTATFVLVIPGDVPQEDPPLELPHGINYLGDGSYLLQLLAPNKDAIFVLGDFNDWQASLQYQMKQIWPDPNDDPL